jgi:hypothetical protein
MLIALASGLLLPTVDVDDPRYAYRYPLQGLKGVYLVLRIKNEGQGIPKEDKGKLVTNVEVKLRMAGIPVLTESQLQQHPGQPILSVDINNMYSQDENNKLFLYDIEVRLYERVRMLRPEVKGAVLASTWSQGTVGSFLNKTEKDHSQKIQGIVSAFIDIFVNDYLAANPRKLNVPVEKQN